MTFKEAVSTYKELCFKLVGSPFYVGAQIEIFPKGSYIFMPLLLYDYLQSEKDGDNYVYNFLKDLHVSVNTKEDATKEDSVIKNYADGFLGDSKDYSNDLIIKI